MCTGDPGSAGLAQPSGGSLSFVQPWRTSLHTREKSTTVVFRFQGILSQRVSREVTVRHCDWDFRETSEANAPKCFGHCSCCTCSWLHWLLGSFTTHLLTVLKLWDTAPVSPYMAVGQNFGTPTGIRRMIGPVGTLVSSFCGVEFLLDLNPSETIPTVTTAALSHVPHVHRCRWPIGNRSQLLVFMYVLHHV